MVSAQPVFAHFYQEVAVQVLDIIIQWESDEEGEEDPYYQGRLEFVVFVL